MTTAKMIDFEALLEEVRQEVVRNVISRLDAFDDPADKLKAVRAISELSFEQDRDRFLNVKPLAPDNLTGSYFRAPDQRDTEAEAAWLDGEACKVVEGKIVAQPFTSPSNATYLVEFYGVHGAAGYQQLMELDRMVNQRWSFFDTAAWLQSAPGNAVTESEAVAVPDDSQ